MPDDKIMTFAHYVEDLTPHIRKASLDYTGWLEDLYQRWIADEVPSVPDEIATEVEAFVDGGRWLWHCKACNSGIPAEPELVSICPQCASQGWVNVKFPDNRDAIEEELLKQPGRRAHAPVRHWRPGWTVDDLKERTEKAQEKLDKGEDFIRTLSIGLPRMWSVDEVLTASNMNTYLSNILHDLIGDNGIIELRTDTTNNEGGLRLPRLTTSQRTAQTATNGTIVYDTTLNRFFRWENGAWVASDDLTHQVLSNFVRGDILYVNASGQLARLPAGTSGSFLQTLGATADPTWAGGSTATFTRFTSSGSYTVPTGVKLVYVEVVGGGARGRGGGISPPRGGKGGWVTRRLFLASSLGTSVTVTVGAIGTQNGNDSSFGTLAVGKGGQNGTSDHPPGYATGQQGADGGQAGQSSGAGQAGYAGIPTSLTGGAGGAVGVSGTSGGNGSNGTAGQASTDGLGSGGGAGGDGSNSGAISGSSNAGGSGGVGGAPGGGGGAGGMATPGANQGSDGIGGVGGKGEVRVWAW